MSKREKLLDSIRNSPNNVTFAQIRKLLESSGFSLERIGGSHHVFKRGDTIIPIPVHNNRVKIVYVKRVIEIIEEHGNS
ncbi:MAG TPA: type II toxin-antitoxin system HicA family toxin [Pyrinomonadaceae bacterium]|nr:type II toxin-antitoxin system HicA family toxin [Pyrinomonadaceae bacterium]